MTFKVIDRREPHAEKPYARRVWRCSSGIYVKTWASQKDVGFGKLQWTITGSHCDASGNAVARGTGYAVHTDAHDFIVESRNDVDASARAAKMRDDYEAALLVVVKRVESAVVAEQITLPA